MKIKINDITNKKNKYNYYIIIIVTIKVRLENDALVYGTNKENGHETSEM